MKMSVKVAHENLEKLSAAISKVEGKSEVNRLSFQTLIELTEHAESKLEDLCIPAKYRRGSQLEFSPSGPYSNSYKYGQGATTVMLIRKSSAWFVQTVERSKVYPKSPEKRILKITSQQRDIAIRKFSRQFEVLPAEINGSALTC